MTAFAYRVVIATLVVGVAFLTWHLRYAIVLAFAAVVVAAILLAGSQLMRRLLPLGHRWSLALAGLLILVAIGLILWFAWPNIQSQFSTLLQRLPEAANEIERRTGISVPSSAGELKGTLGGAFDRIWSDLASIVQATAMAIAGFLLVVIAGVFFAIEPGLYRRGLLLLFPPARYDRIGEALDRTGRALKLWLVGQLLSMSIVGALVGLGVWVMGLPSPLALALFAFLTEFIPTVGPFLGAAPGLLLALGEGWRTLMWTALLYLAVQQLESNLITPIVQRQMVRIPPALFMLSVVAMGGIFGILGVVLAGPLTVASFVLVRSLYVEDMLGTPLGEDADPKAR